MNKLTDEELKSIAEHIILSHSQGIEYLSVWEMTEEKVSSDISEQEMEVLVKDIDALISKATVTVEFED